MHTLQRILASLKKLVPGYLRRDQTPDQEHRQAVSSSIPNSGS